VKKPEFADMENLLIQGEANTKSMEKRVERL